MVWGSVADQMLHQSSVPILLVPRSVDADWARGTPPRLILPLDGSPLAEEALEPAEELARTLGAEVVLVRAVDPTTWLMGTSDPWGSYQPYAAEILAETNEAAAKYLDSVATNLLSKGIPSSVAVVDGHAPSVIRQVAQDNHARAIVMATHGRGGAKRLLVGSVTDAVIRSARVPVLVVRPVAAPKHAVDHTTALLPARDERSLTVRMSPKEVEVVRTALQYLIGGNQAGERAVEAFDVLERFQRVGPRAEATASGSR